MLTTLTKVAALTLAVAAACFSFGRLTGYTDGADDATAEMTEAVEEGRAGARRPRLEVGDGEFAVDKYAPHEISI